MDITGPAHSSPTLTLASPPTAITPWRVGQRLDAVVVSSLGQDRVSLRIGDALIEARAALATAPGQRLSLEVMEADNKQIILRIITDIQGPKQPSPLLTLTSTPAIAALWRVGQHLDAVVVSLLSQDRVSLRIGDAQVEARTSLATTPGQRLSLEVVQADKPIVLRVIAEPTKADPVITALRTALPQQLPLQESFTRFAGLLAASPGLPPTINAMLKQLLQQLPSSETMSRSDTLKQALMDSGPSLEHKLNPQSKTEALDQDLKANLLRLLSEATRNQGSGVADLIRNTEAALARIQLHQLSALTQEQPPMSWAGEVPVRHGEHIDVFQFRIEKDGKQSASAQQQSWSTWLSFSLHTLGPLHTKLTLTGKTISAAFWAESSETAGLLNEHLNHLQQSLELAGLEVADLHCRQGRPPFPTPARFPKGLLDLSA